MSPRTKATAPARATPGGKFPGPDAPTIAFVRRVAARDPRVVVKPMFGHVAGFVRGHLAVCAFGATLALRLDEADRAALLGTPGATPFSPMPGRPMREYVALPPDWATREPFALAWVDRCVARLAARPVRPARAKRR
jgi:hypothetical protein